LENEQVKRGYSTTSALTKYFLHGIIFSLLFSVLAIVWVFVFAFLVMIGYVVGLIIAFILLFFIIGGLNTVLTQSTWDTDIKQDWKSLLGHGTVLLIALILAGIPSLLTYYAYPNLVAEVPVFFARAKHNQRRPF
jgi:uncharacterized membrane protein YagU involved in acid resistance